MKTPSSAYVRPGQRGGGLGARVGVYSTGSDETTRLFSLVMGFENTPPTDRAIELSDATGSDYVPSDPAVLHSLAGAIW